MDISINISTFPCRIIHVKLIHFSELNYFPCVQITVKMQDDCTAHPISCVDRILVKTSTKDIEIVYSVEKKKMQVYISSDGRWGITDLGIGDMESWDILYIDRVVPHYVCLTFLASNETLERIHTDLNVSPTLTDIQRNSDRQPIQSRAERILIEIYNNNVC